MRKKKLIIFIIFLAFVIFLIGRIQPFFGDDDELSIDEIQRIVESRYAAKIVEVDSFKNGGKEMVSVTFENSNGKYRVQIDKDGKILSLVRMKQADENVGGLLDEENAIILVETEKGGKVLSISEISYQSALFYQVRVQAEKEKLYLINRETNKITEQDNKSGIISEERAKEIALNKIAGVISDIDLEEENDAIYYEVEMETEKDKEVKITINGFTGEVHSISWEDD